MKTREISDKTFVEMSEGGKRIRISIAQSYVSVMMAELDRTLQIGGTVTSPSNHPKDLLVTVRKDGIDLHSEPFWEFPSDELKAKIALVKN